MPPNLLLPAAECRARGVFHAVTASLILLCSLLVPPAVKAAAVTGDLNNDTVVDMTDVILCIRQAMGIDPPTPQIADIDGDGRVDVRDVILEMQSLVGYTTLTGVTFHQVVFTFPGLQVPEGVPSGTGYVVLDLSRITAAGFLQVVTRKGWVVANLPVKTLSGVRLGTRFRLADTAEYPLVDAIEASVWISDAPLAAPPARPDFQHWPVTPWRYNAEGKGEAVVQSVPEPPPLLTDFFAAAPRLPAGSGAAETWPFSDVFAEKNLKAVDEDFPISKNFNICEQRKHDKYNIQAANSQCGPAAAANSLQWLEDTWDSLGIDVPHTYGKGTGSASDGTIVGELDKAMKRPHTSRTVGGGVSDANFLKGKLQYLSANKVCLQVKHQDDKMGAADVTAGELTSKANGKASFAFICKEICKGEDVEVGYTYKAGGGHWVNATGCGHIFGRPFVTFVSDHLQSDDDPKDKKGTSVIDFSWVRDDTAGSYISGLPGVKIEQERATADIVVSESPPEIELLRKEDVCPWLKPKPPITESCTGVTHGVGQSEIMVCFTGTFAPGDALTVQFPSPIGQTWSTEFSAPASCVCTAPQTIYWYDDYGYNASFFSAAGGTPFESSGIVSVTADPRACACP